MTNIFKNTLLVFTITFFIINCTTDTTGTGSETDIGTLTAGIYGLIVNTNGTPVEDASVVAISISDSNNTTPIDTVHTNSNGFYNFTTLSSGNYYLEGSLLIDTITYKTIIDSIHYDENLYDSIGLNLGIDTLKLPGSIQGSVSIYKTNKSEILVYIPGTSYIAYTDSLGNFTISNIPADSNYTLTYSYDGYQKGQDTSIVVNPNDTTFLPLKELQFDPNLTPPPPTGLSASIDTTNRVITIEWNKLTHSGLAGYLIYRKDSSLTASEPLKISGNSLISLSDSIYCDSLNLELIQGDTIVLQYQIKSQHKETGNRSDYSNPAFVKVTFYKNSFNKMKLIPGRCITFSMGMEKKIEEIDTNAQPVHNVTLTYDFYIDSTEVTQKEYKDLMTGIHGYNNHEMPSWTELSGLSDNHAAYYVNWFDAVLYCNALSKSKNLDTVYTYSKISYPLKSGPGSGVFLTDLSSDLSVLGYRLPTEAEWEFACRGFTDTDFYWNKNASPYPETLADTLEINKYAIWQNNSKNLGTGNPQYGVNVVATKKPNNFELYDMAGNLFEYCNDFYNANEYERGDVTDPKGSSSGTSIVMRGGDWRLPQTYLRSAYRGFMSTSNESSDFGFRVCLTKK